MANYYINDDILTIASDFNKNIDNDIKNIINTNNISCIKFFSTKYEILNQLNYYLCPLRSYFLFQSFFFSYC